MQEHWKDIPGFEGRYQVSDLGRVKSLAREIVRVRYGAPYTVRWPEKIIAAKVNEAGYLGLTLHRKGVRSTMLVHRLVALAFIPNPLGLPEVDHEDCNPANPRVGNLTWVTSLKNKQLMVERGRSSKGVKNGRAKLTAAQVKEARQRVGAGESCLSVGRSMGVSHAAIRFAAKGSTWGHV
jgi:hypothetical protein